MSKPKLPNQKKKYQELNTRLNKYVALVEQIYDTLNLEAAKAVSRTDYSADSDKPFKWDDYPQTRKQMADIQMQFVDDIHAVIYRGTSEEWKNSNEVQDLIANKVLKTYTGEVNGEKHKQYYQANSDALKAFQNRKERGMNLSANLWNQSLVYKDGLEAAISCAIERGTDAITLSKQISKYLTDFPSLQKDYKEKYGDASNLKDCEYRSIRLARSEINMAYRTAENERWKQMDFVVGYEIKLSGAHHDRMPNGDICDTLAGKYPKDFVWTGWHPNDMCYKIPILKTEEEFWEWDGRDEVSTSSVNEVKDVPENFKKWAKQNKKRIMEADDRGTLPYFLKDNIAYLRYNNGTSLSSQKAGKKTIEEIAKERHSKRDEDAIRLAWHNRFLLDAESDFDLTQIRRNAVKYQVDISDIEKYVATHKFNESFDMITRKERDALIDIQDAFDKKCQKKALQFGKEKSDMISYIDFLPYQGYKEDLKNELRNIKVSKEVPYSEAMKYISKFKKKVDDEFKLYTSSPFSLNKSVASYGEFDTFDLDSAMTGLEKYEAANSYLSKLYGSKNFTNNYLYQQMQGKLNLTKDFNDAFDIFNEEFEKRGLKEVMESINHLKALNGFDTSKLPKSWVGKFNDYVTAINKVDVNVDGYFRIYREIEGAYNMMRIVSDSRCVKFGIDKLSYNTPFGLIDGFESIGINGFDYLAKREFYDKFDKFVPLISKDAGEAWFRPIYSHVRIDFKGQERRLRNSEWYRDGLQYHEFGHAMDELQGMWSNKKDWIELFDKYADKINTDTVIDYTGKIAYGSSIKTKYYLSRKRIDYNTEEMAGSLSDIIVSMDNTHEPFGDRMHDKDYFSSKNNCLAEFIAHASECFWKGNDVFKDIVPDLYDDLKKLYEIYIKKVW